MKTTLLILQYLSLFLTFAVNVHAQTRTDLVLIVRNSDHAKAFTPEDAESERNSAYSLKRIVSGFGTDIKVETLAVEKLDTLDLEVAKKSEGYHLRGLIFLGHGNETLYALNQDELYKPETVAKFIGKVTKLPAVHDKLSIYFAGCKMAGAGHDETTFQEVLFRDLEIETLIENPTLELDVIAHTYGTEMNGSFGPKNTFDVYAVKYHVAQFFQRYQMTLAGWVGAYSPTLMNAVSVLVPAFAGIYLLPDNRSVGIGVGFGVMAMARVFSASASKLGKLVSTHGQSSGFVHDLLAGSLSCETRLEKN